MSKPTWHSRLPWSRLRSWYRSLRRAFFSTSEPTHRPAVTVATDLDTLRRELGRRSFAPNWEYSYHKRGEDLNLAQVVYAPHPVRVGTGLEWFQTHVRGWERDGVVVLRAHWEPEPTEHPKPHLDGVGHSLDGGMERLKQTLDELGLEYVDGDTTADD